MKRRVEASQHFGLDSVYGDSRLVEGHRGRYRSGDIGSDRRIGGSESGHEQQNHRTRTGPVRRANELEVRMQRRGEQSFGKRDLEDPGLHDQRLDPGDRCDRSVVVNRDRNSARHRQGCGNLDVQLFLTVDIGDRDHRRRHARNEDADAPKNRREGSAIGRQHSVQPLR